MTNETKNTPGPWHCISGEVYADQGEVIRIAMMDRNTPATYPTERDANACLIAAAPDLLAELIAYHDREWMQAHEGLPIHSAGELPEQCGGCAAIAKAEGRS